MEGPVSASPGLCGSCRGFGSPARCCFGQRDCRVREDGNLFWLREEPSTDAAMFRHSFAANMAAEGLPLNVIQRQLGHANLSTTSRYLDHVAPEDVVAAVRAMGSST